MKIDCVNITQFNQLEPVHAFELSKFNTFFFFKLHKTEKFNGKFGSVGAFCWHGLSLFMPLERKDNVKSIKVFLTNILNPVRKS